jgi:hypothetical protein
MLRRVHRAVCTICKRGLPRAAARCPWCSYGNDGPARSTMQRRLEDRLPSAVGEAHASSREFPCHAPMKEAFA